MKTKKKVNDLFAFWPYDRFPFILGGKVDHFGEGSIGSLIDHRHVYIESYRGYLKYFHLLPLKVGKEAKQKLEDLQGEYLKAQEVLSSQFMVKRKTLLGKYGIPNLKEGS